MKWKQIQTLMQSGADPEELCQKYNEYLAIKLQLFQSIVQLPDRRDRIILVAYCINECTIKQIASFLGLSWKRTEELKQLAMKKVLDLGEISATQGR